MSFAAIANLVVFVLLAGVLFNFRKPRLSLGRQILLGLLLGAGYGLALQFLYGSGDAAVKETLTWTNVVASGYISLLKMVIMPLVLVMMIAAVVRMREVADLERIGSSVVGILVGTTAVAALVGIFVSNFFGLSADAITQGARELERAASSPLAMRTWPIWAWPTCWCASFLAIFSRTSPAPALPPSSPW